MTEIDLLKKINGTPRDKIAALQLAQSLNCIQGEMIDKLLAAGLIDSATDVAQISLAVLLQCGETAWKSFPCPPEELESHMISFEESEKRLTLSRDDRFETE